MSLMPVLAAATALTLTGGDGGPIRIRLLVAPDAPAAEAVQAGVALGIEEGERAAELLGRTLEVGSGLPTPTPDPGMAGTIAVPGSGGLERAVQRHTTQPVLVITGDDPGVYPGAFVVSYAPPSADIEGPARADCGTPIRVAWHSSFERYGAGQLNERFERRHGRPMTGPAWAGWVAVKALIEAALRTSPGSTPELAEALGSLRFDGHKGRALYFDENRVLVHPFYSVADCEGRLRVHERPPL
jgi:hypothetical protein